MAKHPRSSSPHRASRASTGRPPSPALTAVQDSAHLQGTANLRESIERLVDTGLRLNEQASSDALHAFLIEEVAELLGAQRVLLVLETAEAGTSPAPRCQKAKRRMRCCRPSRPGSMRPGARARPACGTAPKAPTKSTSVDVSSLR